MQGIFRTIDSFNDTIGKVLSFLNIAIVGLVLWEIVARYVFNAPTLWGLESMVMLTGFLYALTGGYTQLYKRHVRVDILYDRLSPMGQAICDGITYIFFCFLIFALIWAGVGFAWDSIRVHETSGSPWNPVVYPLKWAVPVGGFLLWIQVTSDVMRRFLSVILRIGSKGKEV